MANILLVDDLPMVLEVISRLLGKLEHKVTTAADAHEAMALLAGPQRFDLAIIDVLLKATSGIELAKQVRAREPGLPIVAMTAHIGMVSPGSLATLRGLGVDRVIEKPVNLGDLDAAVKGALRKARPTP
jgi:CheY-like chemotaxis protein